MAPGAKSLAGADSRRSLLPALESNLSSLSWFFCRMAGGSCEADVVLSATTVDQHGGRAGHQLS